MPRVLELKIIKGEVWACIGAIDSIEGLVMLVSEDELDAIKLVERRRMADILQDAVSNPEKHEE